MIDPGGQDQDVSAAIGGSQDVPDDLVEAVFVGDQGTIDFGYSAWGAGVGAAGVAEGGGMQVKYRVRSEQVLIVCGKLAGARTVDCDVV
jgi:hypothetical protein